jgi:hypothetical protein
VSAQNAKSAAGFILSRLDLASHGSGSRLQLAVFDTDDDCRFFYPRRALEWQRQVNTYISRALRPKGIRVDRVSVTPQEYDRWRGSAPDTAELRRTFVDQNIRFL